MRTDEKRILSRVIDDALAAGYRLRVWDGGDEPAVEITSDRNVAIAGCDGVDEAILAVVKPDNSLAGEIVLVFGNEPGVLIADYHLALEDLLQGTIALANKLASAV